MVWLMAYLAQHIAQIALIGTLAGTIYSVETTAVETAAIIKEVEKK